MKIRNTSLRAQIVFIIAVFGTVVTTFVAFLLAAQQRQAYYDQYATDLDNVSRRIGFDAERISDDLMRDVRLLSNTPAIQGFVRAIANEGVDPVTNISQGEWSNAIEALFISVANARTHYAQIRLIGNDDNGMELVRIERRDSEVTSVAVEELQPKGDRDYFLGVQELDRGDLYFSAVDLNKERGVIEVPHKPTLRVATPVFTAEGQRFGLLVINWDIGILFSEIAEELRTYLGIEQIQTYITNSDGEFLFHTDPDRTFGFEFGESFRFQQDFSELATVTGEQLLQDSLSQLAETSLFTASLDDRHDEMDTSCCNGV